MVQTYYFFNDNEKIPLLSDFTQKRFGDRYAHLRAAEQGDIITALTYVTAQRISFPLPSDMSPGYWEFLEILAQDTALHAAIARHFDYEAYVKALPHDDVLKLVDSLRGPEAAQLAAKAKKSAVRDSIIAVAREAQWLPDIITRHVPMPTEPASIAEKTWDWLGTDNFPTTESVAAPEATEDETEALAETEPATPRGFVDILGEITRINSEGKAKASKLLAAYNDLAVKTDAPTINIFELVAEMEKRGYEKKRFSTGVHYIGLELSIAVEASAQ